MAKKRRPDAFDLAAVMLSALERDERSYYAISQAAEIRPEVLTRFANGERDLKLATAAKICKVLHLELKGKQ